ncbi:MAG: Trehalose-6-phosphate phosphatase [uncultured Nocardioidaceae bacterium]|uniref:Trehalose 6-phosphate phosphatase n=1 Tax=uncultured Nocardioidaceae bacterium TaxID=253824 RepID=A0A6J4M0F5_9ACTN|nr:MAG: Trehalose-6-phosphate phosphatase [uncultured Nocardioidaceae bacterium]
MDLRSPRARQRYDDLVAGAGQGVVCLDFDGVLAPIVDDPARAHIHPEAPDVLVALTAQFRAVAVVTGRPARQAVSLGHLDEVGARAKDHGRDLLVLGQYGHERWSASTDRVVAPRPPRGLASLAAELPELLRREGLEDAHLEQKSLAVAVHTRRLPDPQGALERLAPVLQRAAAAHGLTLEPGRMVLEARAPGMNKGNAVRTLQKEHHADAMVFVGDDLGDVEAFEAIAALRRGGMVGLLVCSGSEEQRALVDLADVVVDGPDGVMQFLRQLATDAGDHADPPS